MNRSPSQSSSASPPANGAAEARQSALAHSAMHLPEAGTDERTEASVITNPLQAFEHAAVGMARVGTDGRWQWMNRKLRALLALPSEACLLGQPCAEQFGPGQAVLLDRLLNQSGTCIEETCLLSQTDEPVPVRISASEAPALWFSEAKAPDILLIVEDLSALQQAEAAKLRTERRYEFVLEGSNEGLYEWDVSSNTVHWNPSYYHLLGWEGTEPAPGYEEFLELVHPDDRDRVMTEIQSHFGDPTPYVLDYRIKHRNGTYRHMRCRGRTFFENGQPIRISGLVQDVTESVHVQQALQESEARFRQLFDSNLLGIFFGTIDGVMLEANDALLGMLGYTQADLQAGRLDWSKLIPESELPAFRERIAELREKRLLRPYERQYRHQNGSLVDTLVGAALLDGSDDKVVCFVLDITSRKQAEEAQQISLAREQLLRHHLELVNQTFDLDSILQNATREIGQFFGADRCTVMRYSQLDNSLSLDLSAQYCRPGIRPVEREDLDFIIQAVRHLTPDMLEEGQAQVTEVQDPEAHLAQTQQRLADLQIPLDTDYFRRMFIKYSIKTSLRVAISYRGIPYGSLSLSHCAEAHPWSPDEIELVKMLASQLGGALYQAELYLKEQQARQAAENYTRKLEASNKELEEFAFVASHDLQAPLRKITMFSTYLRDTGREVLPPESLDYLGRITTTTHHMQSLVTDLLNLSRIHRKGQPFATTCLNTIIEGVLNDLQPLIEETDAQVTVAPLPPIEVDAAQMHQLFQNLIENALKFRRPGLPPQVAITAETPSLSEATATVPKAVRIHITDNGIGLDNQYASRIFRIFERLRPSEYEGTGIGLAICKKIMDRHNGSITAEGLQTGGSRFTVELPGQQPAQPLSQSLPYH